MKIKFLKMLFLGSLILILISCDYERTIIGNENLQLAIENTDYEI